MRLIIFGAFCLLMSSCAEEFLNPYDPATPPDSWMPTGLVIDTLGNNSVRLSWQQDELHIDGYLVRRDISGQISEFTIPFDSLTFSDIEVIDSTLLHTCTTVTYTIMARAGGNLSSALASVAIALPLVTDANAGQDISRTSLTVNLGANPAAAWETGQWSVVSGTGGTFSDASLHNTTFTGALGETYLLRWQIIGVCSSSTDEVAVAITPELGDAYQGGIVFYLDGNGGGLVAAITDQSTGAPWGCDNADQNGDDNMAVPELGGIGSGQANTTCIVNNCAEVGIAARICNDLTLGGYTDWFLPSRAELQLMYQNLCTQGAGNFSSASYWSSTETSADYAWLFNFESSVSGIDGSSRKNDTYYVRAVRAF